MWMRLNWMGLMVLLGACVGRSEGVLLTCETEHAGSGRGGALPAGGLRLATWNMAWLAAVPGEGEIPRSEADYERLRGYADSLGADVIALQEVDGADAAKRVFDPAAYGFHFSERDHVQRTGFAFRRSLSVVRHPDLVDLDVGGQRRGADLTIQWPGGPPLRLLSVHLASGCFDDPLDSSDPACRRLSAQLQALEAWIDARSEQGTAAIVLGDFNRRFFESPGGDVPWRALDDADPPPSDLSSPTDGRLAACLDGRYPDFIDHLVFNALADPLRVPGSFQEHLYDARDAAHQAVLSDHCPLSVRIDGAE